MSYFDDWGTKKNPIRQSDLVSLFGSVHRCAKKFAMSKLYPVTAKRHDFKMAMGDIIHRMIHAHLVFGSVRDIQDFIDEYEKHHEVQINFKKEVREKQIYNYQLMMNNLTRSKEYKAIKKRVLEVERSFIVEIGQHWVAGTIDVMVKGKKKDELVIIDWKTGHPPVPQYQMDHGYQSRIYCHAVKSGEFFVKPEDMSDGRAYYHSWDQTLQKTQHGVWPNLIYGYVFELIPAARKSVRKASHISTVKMSGEDGKLHIEKGERRGPVWYETKVNTKSERLEYSLACAVLMAKSGVFPETFGYHCKECLYLNRCENMGSFDQKERQEVMDLMDQIGIEPD